MKEKENMEKMKKWLLGASFGVIFVMTQVSLAATVNWTATGTDGNWTVGTNWDTGTVPTSADNANIDSGRTCNVTTDLGTGNDVNSLNLGNIAYGADSTLNISGEGRIDTGRYVMIGTNKAVGIINVSGNGKLYNASGFQTVLGYYYTQSVGYLNISDNGIVSSSAEIVLGHQSTGTSTPHGYVTITDSGSLSGSIAIGNYGRSTLTMDGTSHYSGTWMTVGSSTAEGTFTMIGGGTGNATVSTYGSLYRANTGDNATLAFQVDDAGITKLTINGDLRLYSASADRDILIDVTALNENIFGTYTLLTWAGAYNTTNANGAELALTQASIDAGWTLNVDTTAQTVTATLVPEPVTMAVLCMGGMLMVRRKK